MKHSFLGAYAAILLCTAATAGAPAVPPGVIVTTDVAYGHHELQRFDVYAQRNAHDAPIIVMVHGGGWRFGDKTNARVVEGKMAHWVPKGFVFVSANNRLLPDADPVQQAEDVASMLAAVQARAALWGGDPSRVILMGHSAGAHLVALVAADPALRNQARPWLATVSLDTGSLDVVDTMRRRHLRLYDVAFGDSARFWRRASPMEQLDRGAPPFLLVCSTRRDDACPQGDAFAAKAEKLGIRAATLRRDFSHAGINELLGVDAGYTRAVDEFLGSLDAKIAGLLDVPAPRAVD